MKKNNIEEKIIKVFQWILGISFLILGTIILFNGGSALGIAYIFLGVVTIPLLELPKGTRTLAIIIGSVIL